MGLLLAVTMVVGVTNHVQADVTYGYTTVNPSVTPSVSQDFLMGFSINVTEPLYLTHVGVIPSSSGTFDPTVKVGIYADSSGTPSAKVAETSGTTVPRGVGSHNLIPVTSPVTLDPGIYWFMANFQSGALMAAPGSITQQIKYVALAYGSSLPDTYPSHNSYNGNVSCYYLSGTAVPEPGTALLMVVTAVGMGLCRLRRRQEQARHPR
jgi:hypothetical protein